MTKSVKNRVLYQLNYLKSIGVNYHENIDFQESLNSNLNLPDNIQSLKLNVENCYLCQLSKTRKKAVFGEGNINAKLMFIGDIPNISEDEIGRPFMGRAGEILNKMIENVLHLKRSDVYITNTLKCKEGSSSLNINEINLCRSYLLKEIELVNPSIIVCLGQKSYSNLTEENIDISKIRGREMSFKDKVLLTTYHPSFLLRNPSLKKDVYVDMLKLKNILERL